MSNIQDLIRNIEIQSRSLLPVPTGETFRMSGKENPHPKPRVIIFDIYGTLFISASGDISLAEKNYTRSEKLQGVVQHFQCSIPGHELSTLFMEEVITEHKRLKAQGFVFPEVRVEELWARILHKDPVNDIDDIKAFALAYELAVNPVYPMPGLSRILEIIKSRGIPMGIISNAQFFTPLLFPAFLKNNTENLGFDKKLCFYSYEYRKGKPDSFLYDESVKALDKMGILPHECLYIGNDMRNDIVPAYSSGFQTALFAGDKRSLRWREELPECRSITPDIVLSSLEDIEYLI